MAASPLLRSALVLALVATLAACEVERRPAEPLVRFASTDSTLACGAFDFPPPDTTVGPGSVSWRDTPSLAPASPRADSAAPNPREVNPLAVEVEGTAPAPAEALPTGRLAIPVAGIDPDDLFDTFTDARGQGRVHNAIDIMAPRGTPVRAAAPGRILRLFESERGGLTVYQLGEDEQTVYYYAHLDAYAPGLEAGQHVTRGDAVGTVGDSGNAAPGNTHLHFAVWTVDDPTQFWDGEPVNPYPLLAP